jgi:YkoY family integral membrane protein
MRASPDRPIARRKRSPVPFGVEWSDLLTVALLVLLEGLLSGDNALVLAVLVLPLPEDQQRKALRYGLLGAFVLRVIATFLAAALIQVKWVALAGGLYLLWLPYKHFTSHPDEENPDALKQATGWFGLSLFWTIVIKADLVDLVFAVDSILAAVGMTKKLWVVIAGGLLGILMMRLLTLQVLELVKRFPKIIDGAYIVIAWVGICLVFEYFHHLHWIPFEINHVVKIAVVIALFVASFLYARAHQGEGDGVVETCEDAERMIEHLDDPEHPAGGDGSAPEDASSDEATEDPLSEHEEAHRR